MLPETSVGSDPYYHNQLLFQLASRGYGAKPFMLAGDPDAWPAPLRANATKREIKSRSHLSRSYRSITGLMLRLRYSLVRRKFHIMAEIYSTYRESPGTKAY